MTSLKLDELVVNAVLVCIIYKAFPRYQPLICVPNSINKYMVGTLLHKTSLLDLDSVPYSLDITLFNQTDFFKFRFDGCKSISEVLTVSL